MKTSIPEESIFYTYVYLDTRKPGRFSYGDFITFFYEPYYVGKGNGDRIFNHLRNSKSSKQNKHKYFKIKNIINDGYNPENSIIKIIDNIKEIDSLYFEKYLIKLIGRHDLNLGPLTNLTFGGDGISGYKFSEDMKEKLSNYGKYFWQTEYGIYLRNKRSIEDKGKKKSEETKEKMNIKRFGRKMSEETKKKISDANKGRKASEETKRKMSISRTGKKLSKESLVKMSKSQIKRYEKEIELYGEILKKNITDEGRVKLSKIGKINGNNRKGKTSHRKGKVLSEEHKKNLRKPKSEKGKENIKLAQKIRREKELKI
jgi:hypothetical protein